MGQESSAEPDEAGESDDAFWLLVFKGLSLRYGWTPMEIAHLTPQQILYYTSEGEPGALHDPDPAEVMSWMMRMGLRGANDGF